MMIIGCDFHTRYQQIAMMDESTGERVERRLGHESGEAHAFHRNLQGPVRVGHALGLVFSGCPMLDFRAWGFLSQPLFPGVQRPPN
ncbi:MAG: hypothetical protein ACYDDI_06680 [Candidatus Acidiferrales bacterium]